MWNAIPPPMENPPSKHQSHIMNVKTQIKFISAHAFKHNLNNNGVQSLYRPIMILDSGIPESTSF